MDGSMASLTAVADGDVYTRSILNLEVTEQEALALLEADHCTRIEGFAILSCEPPACTLTVDDRSFTFTLDNNVGNVLALVLSADEDNLIVWRLAVFHELQCGTCAEVKDGLRLDAEYFGLASHLICTSKHPDTGRNHDHTTGRRHSIKCFLDSLGVICSRCRGTIILDVKRVCRSDGWQLWQFYGSPSFRSVLCTLLSCDTSESLCLSEHWQSHERSKHDCFND